jgi:acetoin utilization protein AcuB
MTHKTSIAELMTPNPVTVSPEATLWTIRTVWKDHAIHHLPVVNERGYLVGILSYTDFIRASRELFHTQIEQAEEAHLLQTILVKDVMSDLYRVIALDSGAYLIDAIRLFKTNRFHSIPIIEGKRLVGIVTVFDMILALESILDPDQVEKKCPKLAYPLINFGF